MCSCFIKPDASVLVVLMKRIWTNHNLILSCIRYQMGHIGMNFLGTCSEIVPCLKKGRLHPPYSQKQMQWGMSIEQLWRTNFKWPCHDHVATNVVNSYSHYTQNGSCVCILAVRPHMLTEGSGLQHVCPCQIFRLSYLLTNLSQVLVWWSCGATAVVCRWCCPFSLWTLMLAVCRWVWHCWDTNLCLQVWDCGSLPQRRAFLNPGDRGRQAQSGIVAVAVTMATF